MTRESRPDVRSEGEGSRLLLQEQESAAGLLARDVFRSTSTLQGLARDSREEGEGGSVTFIQDACSSSLARLTASLARDSWSSARQVEGREVLQRIKIQRLLSLFLPFTLSCTSALLSTRESRVSLDADRQTGAEGRASRAREYERHKGARSSGKRAEREQKCRGGTA